MDLKPAILHGYISRDLGIDGSYHFGYHMYMRPSLLPEADQEFIVKTLGDRRVDGKPALDTTREVARQSIQDDDYHLFILVENLSLPKGSKDEGTAILQYNDWCSRGSKQLWLFDLVRQTNLKPRMKKPAISPIQILFSVLEDFARERGIPSMYLMVDQDDAKSHKALTTKVYPKYGYVVDPGCPGIEGLTVMRHDLNLFDGVVNSLILYKQKKAKKPKRRQTRKRKSA
uniref:N-acetyltransferase domain-containing protein n=1 Tax=viral metagenome TaxID=1070528 RepID=A0A6C0AQS3_9ZZZZ